MGSHDGRTKSKSGFAIGVVGVTAVAGGVVWAVNRSEPAATLNPNRPSHTVEAEVGYSLDGGPLRGIISNLRIDGAKRAVLSTDRGGERVWHYKETIQVDHIPEVTISLSVSPGLPPTDRKMQCYIKIDDIPVSSEKHARGKTRCAFKYSPFGN